MCKIMNKKIIYNIHLRRSCMRVGGNIAMCVGRGDWGSSVSMGVFGPVDEAGCKGEETVMWGFCSHTLHPPARGEFVSTVGLEGLAIIFSALVALVSRDGRLHMITFLMEHIIHCSVSSRWLKTLTQWLSKLTSAWSGRFFRPNYNIL